MKDFKQWVLSLKPRAVIEYGISRPSLFRVQKRLIGNNIKYKSKIFKKLYTTYKKYYIYTFIYMSPNFRILYIHTKSVRVPGFEPEAEPWQGSMLPNYTTPAWYL